MENLSRADYEALRDQIDDWAVGHCPHPDLLAKDAADYIFVELLGIEVPEEN